MAPPKKGKGPGGRPKVPEPRKIIASFRGSGKFAEWFAALVAHRRMPASTVIEHALILYAQETGFDDPPPER